MTEYLEVILPTSVEKTSRKVWREMGCRCLRKPWAEPWADNGLWYSYHFMACPVAKSKLQPGVVVAVPPPQQPFPHST